MVSDNQKKWWILTGTGISAIIIAIDATIVNTALPTIQRELSTSLTQLQWAIAGFILMFSSLLVSMGRLGDIVGRRLLLYIGMIGFGLASVGAGFSDTSGQLILFRFLQGIFGAIVFPNSMAITASAFPKNEQGKAMGFYGAILGFGLAIGPVLGGVITNLWSWHWIFFINIPIILISFIVCFGTVGASKIQERQAVDWWGMIFTTLFLVSLVYAITQGSEVGWGSLIIVGSFCVSIISFIILLIIETKVSFPLLPFKKFANIGFIQGAIVNIVAVSFAWPVLFLSPLYLQNVLNLTVQNTGLVLLAMTAMTAILPFIAGYMLDKRGAFFTTLIMFILLFISYFIQVNFSVSSSLIIIILAFITFGSAWGIGNGIGVALALSKLESSDDVGLISGASVTILNMMGAISLTIIVTLFRISENAHLLSRLSKNNIILSKSQLDTVRSALSNPIHAKAALSNFSSQFADKIIGIFKSAFVDGFHTAIYALIILSVILFIAMLSTFRKFKTKLASSN